MTTWNPADKSALITLSNGNLTATHDATVARGVVRANAALPALSKTFFSYAIGTAVGSNPGFANGAASLSSFLGSDFNGLGYFSNGEVWIGNALQAVYGTFTAGDVIDAAVDLASNRLWLRKNGGVWNGSGAASPAANIGGLSIAGMTAGPYFPAIDMAANGSGSVNFGATPFTYSPPSGFAAVDPSARLSGTLGPVGLAGGNRGAVMAATLGLVTASAGLFKWDDVPAATTAWTPVFLNDSWSAA